MSIFSQRLRRKGAIRRKLAKNKVEPEETLPTPKDQVGPEEAKPDPRKPETDSEQLQGDLDIIQEWETRWDKQFNPSKCQVIHISRSRSEEEIRCVFDDI